MPATDPLTDVALAHDYLLTLRGAERTFAAICDTWPGAPVYTLLYDREGTHDRFATHRVTASALQRIGVGQSSFRTLLPLFPIAVSRLGTAGHGVVVSSSSAFAHGVPVAPGAVHVCYCHSPFRYAWFERRRALSEIPAALAPGLSAVLRAIRRWDRGAAARVTRYIANSTITQRRIRDFYGRDSVVIHPPVEVERFRSGEPADYFLLVSEIVRHKRIEVAAAAATEAGASLRVVGSGPDLERLRSLYPEVQFLGRVDDAGLEELYAHAAAAIVPNIEEFGIAAVEAQASGRPVLAVRAGGALETVRDGETGRFFAAEDVSELAGLLRTFDPDEFDRDVIVAHAQQFSAAAFRQRMRDEVADAVRDADDRG